MARICWEFRVRVYGFTLWMMCCTPLFFFCSFLSLLIRCSTRIKQIYKNKHERNEILKFNEKHINRWSFTTNRAMYINNVQFFVRLHCVLTIIWAYAQTRWFKRKKKSKKNAKQFCSCKASEQQISASRFIALVYCWECIINGQSLCTWNIHTPIWKWLIKN